MLPSPSLGPPELSLSLSPAFGPCGIPFELEPELVDVVAGAAEELVDLEDDEPPPQPATAIAATAISAAIHRRAVAGVLVIVLPLIPVGTAHAGNSFPANGVFSRRSRAPIRRRSRSPVR